MASCPSVLLLRLFQGHSLQTQGLQAQAVEVLLQGPNQGRRIAEIPGQVAHCLAKKLFPAPKMMKIATSIPCLRVNSGLVKPGDMGRIVSRKPKDVWAVRLTIGTYLIDGKYFKPLELDERFRRL
ncbi:hypothetical protein CJ030_MR1G003958 [Morella rubra]|uniref:Uncharacterized protein n=1 Tax=Morella rubra TaxID=262757 RepID=A0A6A1WSZ1_9ROSI|nr:hypothetical protein CJ030_MR1G003958 [Morella rubra]